MIIFVCVVSVLYPNFFLWKSGTKDLFSITSFYLTSFMQIGILQCTFRHFLFYCLHTMFYLVLVILRHDHISFKIRISDHPVYLSTCQPRETRRKVTPLGPLNVITSHFSLPSLFAKKKLIQTFKNQHSASWGISSSI